MIKASAGTACILGLKKLKTDAPPTTAYFMVGEKCVNNCSFCTQARDSQAGSNFLSRIVWPEFEQQEVYERLGDAAHMGSLKRACLQVVQGSKAMENTKTIVQDIKHKTDIPVCVSLEINNPDEVKALLDCGVDKVCIALDAVTEEAFTVVKGSDFKKRIRLLEECAGLYKGRITTHLIAGLGETELEMIEIIQRLSDLQVTISLFAFTPVKGTALELRPKPPIGKYRRIQAAHFFITSGRARLDNFEFNIGRVSRINLQGLDWRKEITDSEGKAFRTSGCPDCNRPYYNETPQGTIYNYPRVMTEEEVKNAIEQCEID